MKMDLMSEKLLLSSIAASFALSTPLSVLPPVNKLVINDLTIADSESSSYIHNGFNIRTFRQKILDYQLVELEEKNPNLIKNHSKIRTFQKLKKIPVNGSNDQETATALFINREISDIEVEDHVFIDINEGQLYSFGDKGTAVKEIQSFLIDAGYYHYRKDGIFGPVTKNAVLNYQKENGLLIDGIVGQQTYEHLKGTSINVKTESKNVDNLTTSIHSVKVELDSTPEASIPSSIQKIEKNDLNKVDFLQNSDHGQAVKDLQRLLKNKGYYPNGIDGVFGSITEAAVRTYQIENNLSADGIAGSVTITHIKNTPSKPLTSRSTYPPVVTEKTAVTITADGIINFGRKLIGTPYIWGGTTSIGFDCSGFLMYVFKKNGVSLPRTVSEIWSFGKGVQEPKPGDLVFFETYKKGPSHAGIYLGNQKFLHAGSSTGVTISDLTNNYWSSRYLGAKRIN
ncbi:peptidoglycan-binding protein [Bacillaceae bacterium IKA-2]|nr:peptidoglycan-binding protein [Bacillaceae bacterium IKA-2]